MQSNQSARLVAFRRLSFLVAAMGLLTQGCGGSGGANQPGSRDGAVAEVAPPETDARGAGGGGGGGGGDVDGSIDLGSRADGAVGNDRPELPDLNSADVPAVDGTRDAVDAGAPDLLLPVANLATVRPTPGCGQGAGRAGAGTVSTMGVKEPGCTSGKCGAWAYSRNYFVNLPRGYVDTKPYPLVVLAPGCKGTAQNVLALNDGTADNVGDTVIRVGISPPPDAIGHAPLFNQGCFDDREGDDSVDWPFYEALYDRLAEQFCFDRNRVFAGGMSSGAWWADELGCKYAGDDTRPIRAILSSDGGLLTAPQYTPTCTTQPMAGFWVYTVDETVDTMFSGYKTAVRRAMAVNGCTIGSHVDNTEFDDYPIGGGQPANTCRRIRGCPALHPLVLCRVPRSTLAFHEPVMNAGGSAFIKQFSQPPLLSP